MTIYEAASDNLRYSAPTELADFDALGDVNYDALVQERFEAMLSQAATCDKELDQTLVRRAFEYARDKHSGQTRRSGEPYILHPIAVAAILADLEMGAEVLAAALLHDVVEDCGVSREELAGVFGEEIAQLVDGVTKLKLADFEARRCCPAQSPARSSRRSSRRRMAAKPLRRLKSSIKRFRSPPRTCAKFCWRWPAICA